MELDVVSGKIKYGASQISSPNYDLRCYPFVIDVLVVHAISLPPGQFGGGFIESLFTNTLHKYDHPYFEKIRSLRVSSHFYIKRNGDLTQFVPTQYRAWHAGESQFLGRQRVNDFSIGIELEGSDEKPFKEAQYARLAELADCLMLVYQGISPDRIVGHCDISPDRKTDPGPCFNWGKFKSGLKNQAKG